MRDTVSIGALRRGSIAASRVTAAAFSIVSEQGLQVGTDTVGRSTYFTASGITPTANAVVLVWVFNSALSASAVTVTGLGATWAPVGTVVAASNGFEVRTSLVAATSFPSPGGQLTLAFSGTQTGCAFAVQEIVGSVAPAVKQSKTASDSVGTTSASATLDSAPAATSAVAAGFFKAVSDAMSPTGGFASRYENGYLTPATRFIVMYDITSPGSSPGASWAPTFVGWSGIAVEVGAP